MDKRKTTYCEFGFWREFSSDFPQKMELDDEAKKSVECWLHFYDLCSNVNLKFDITYDQLKEDVQKDELLLKLWKRSSNGACGLECEADKFPHIDQLSPDALGKTDMNAVFLTNKDSDTCLQKSQEFGVLVLNNQNRENFKYLFSDNSVAIDIRDSNIHSWDFLKNYGLNICNSIIVVDNYLLSSAENINDNLLPILNILLQKKSKVPIHISIFCDLHKSKNMPENQLKSKVEETYELISKNIGKQTSDFKLTIYYGANHLHDREILTNNAWIGCGAGFDLFKRGQSTKQTKVQVLFPFVKLGIDGNSADETAYMNLLKETLKIDQNSVQTQYVWNYVGDKTNRLMDCYR